MKRERKKGLIRSVNLKQKKRENWSDEVKLGIRDLPSSLQSGHCRRTRSLFHNTKNNNLIL